MEVTQQELDVSLARQHSAIPNLPPMFDAFVAWRRKPDTCGCWECFDHPGVTYAEWHNYLNLRWLRGDF